ncbi:hypothetical protein PIB30_054889 [Stylosanthes scabra]|uniref:Uncharacterized protein n=1 Tax=Stylosanthes scabra TaxID=79078 RepID=A0ABU6ZHM9_9FABA|nr:hypothetical protein [Stylosanthes scabra]
MFSASRILRDRSDINQNLFAQSQSLNRMGRELFNNLHMKFYVLRGILCFHICFQRCCTQGVNQGEATLCVLAMAPNEMVVNCGFRFKLCSGASNPKTVLIRKPWISPYLCASAIANSPYPTKLQNPFSFPNAAPSTT